MHLSELVPRCVCRREQGAIVARAHLWKDIEVIHKLAPHRNRVDTEQHRRLPRVLGRRVESDVWRCRDVTHAWREQLHFSGDKTTTAQASKQAEPLSTYTACWSCWRVTRPESSRWPRSGSILLQPSRRRLRSPATWPRFGQCVGCDSATGCGARRSPERELGCRRARRNKNKWTWRATAST